MQSCTIATTQLWALVSNYVISDNYVATFNITGRDVESAYYHSGPYNIIFPVGETHFLLNVTIVNDNILENNETFNLTINSSSLPGNVEVGNPGQATVTIRDDDGMYAIAWIKLHSNNLS